MLTEKDIKQISAKGMTREQIEQQLENMRNGFPYIRIQAAASIGNGIISVSEEQMPCYTQAWEKYKAERKRIVKFVPASGAASRMFKDIYSYLGSERNTPETSFEKKYLDNICNFAFYDALDNICREKEDRSIAELISEGNTKAVAANMVDDSGLGYGHLPKGLILFHKYVDGARTPIEEHLVESALYAESCGTADIHFTVSHEHLPLFKAEIEKKRTIYENKFGIKYNISFSEQKPNTDTIAANIDNTPFRTETGELLFRPGGHGALIENLNDIDADVIFIKNIDNVVPERLNKDTVTYKQLIAGILVASQQKAFQYLRQIDNDEITDVQTQEILRFIEQTFCVHNPSTDNMNRQELMKYLHDKLNRPMRVCGVVRNVGEPGGGPFITINKDGSTSPQILESSQIDKNNSEYMQMFEDSTHFNPVDIVCAVKDYKGNHFNLPTYADPETGFISRKSSNGKELKALELPGLWNGAMSDWNTIFVEVPLTTFNPVKTVNDLLREEHRNMI